MTMIPALLLQGDSSPAVGGGLLAMGGTMVLVMLAIGVVFLVIPLVNLVIMVILSVDVAKAFGKSAVFGVVLLFLLGGIGCLVLGFGNARYVKPATAVAR